MQNKSQGHMTSMWRSKLWEKNFACSYDMNQTEQMVIDLLEDASLCLRCNDI